MKLISQYDLFQLMLSHMGPTGWWPADTKTEIVVGAILIQNTNWLNAELALKNLKDVTALDADRILELEIDVLVDLIRPAGFYRNKARAIKAVLTWLAQFDSYVQITMIYGDSLRKELLKLRGVGEETADVYLLYIFDQPIFIADKYAQKLYTQLGYSSMLSYKTMRQQIHLAKDFTLWEAQEFHGLIDEFGKLYLRGGKTNFHSSFLAGYLLKG